MGWSSVLAGAPTPRAAFWLAWVGKQKFIGESAELEPVLAALPLEVLRCGDETLAAFQAIGVRTLGELRALPREGIARRFGQGPLAELDRALGRLPDPRNFFVPPARFGAAIELPAEVTQAEALLFAARRLIVQLAGYLAARSGGVQRFVLRLRHRDKPRRNRDRTGRAFARCRALSRCSCASGSPASSSPRRCASSP